MLWHFYRNTKATASTVDCGVRVLVATAAVVALHHALCGITRRKQKESWCGGLRGRATLCCSCFNGKSKGPLGNKILCTTATSTTPVNLGGGIIVEEGGIKNRPTWVRTY